MLEQAGCTKIQMEALICEYQQTVLGTATTIGFRRIFYVNSPEGEPFEVNVPKRSACNDDTTWIMHGAISGGVRRRVTARRFTTYPEEPSLVVRTEKMLAEYYAGRLLRLP
jgi:hypothetical protein